MIALIISLHVTICLMLLVIVLIQAGRGGGFIEGFSGMESMFGTKSNSFLTRTTTVLSVLFFITCLTLAVLAAKQGKSLMEKVKAKPAQINTAQDAQELTTKQEASKTDAPIQK